MTARANSTSSIRSHREGGFSLIELMITICIIGILSVMAVPAYDKFVAKVRQSEAKIALSAVYTAEQLFQGETARYTLCIWQAGYMPEPGGKRFYTVGSWYGVGTIVYNYDTTPWTYCNPGDGPNGSGNVAFGNALRNDTTIFMSAAANSTLMYTGAGGAPPSTDPIYGGPTDASGNAFKMAAWGSVSSRSSVYDIWTINNRKSLVNVQAGY